ncbi:transporter substrate-binding domain-containing protein [Kutzneria kofuensis]|uniref:Polar amino acid transport system substrate-binding protein n=1 Tax=Kutzneria kofuensis TaxID=103725 RepID=A0A7W9KCA3_9PSEU|nr:transporter substrate-binding domain-containing protein [Kutzneria kofuensis]MBB5889965.1 polar amino acid transport system substrate-binding protein [Kutzneria kofuensis]
MSIRTAVAVTAGALVLSGCGSSTSDDAYGLPDPGVIHAATDSSQPPFAYGDSSGKPIGFVIDVTDEVAKRLHLTVDYKATSVASSLAGLTTHQYDLAASGLGVTAERQKTVSFTKPLFWSTTAVLTTTRSTLSDLTAFGGRKVGVVTGTAQVAFVPAKMPGASPVNFPNSNVAISQLLNGSIDAFVVGGPDAEHFLKQYPALRLAASAPVDHPTSMAVAKDHAALLDAVDKQIAAMVADGTYARLYRKYFTTAPLPQLVSAWPDLGRQFSEAAK